MSDLTSTAIVAGATISVVAVSRAYIVVRLASIRASLNPTPAEYCMMEKAAKPFKVKAHKSPAPIPFGL